MLPLFDSAICYFLGLGVAFGQQSRGRIMEFKDRVVIVVRDLAQGHALYVAEKRTSSNLVKLQFLPHGALDPVLLVKLDFQSDHLRVNAERKGADGMEQVFSKSGVSAVKDSWISCPFDEPGAVIKMVAALRDEIARMDPVAAPDLSERVRTAYDELLAASPESASETFMLSVMRIAQQRPAFAIALAEELSQRRLVLGLNQEYEMESPRAGY